MPTKTFHKKCVACGAEFEAGRTKRFCPACARARRKDQTRQWRSGGAILDGCKFVTEARSEQRKRDKARRTALAARDAEYIKVFGNPFGEERKRCAL